MKLYEYLHLKSLDLTFLIKKAQKIKLQKLSSLVMKLLTWQLCIGNKLISNGVVL